MKPVMHRSISPLICLGLAPLLCLMGSAAQSGDRSDGQKPPLDQVTVLIEQLEHPEFSVREEASRRLLEKGAEAIPPLVEAALAGPPEAAARALNVLEGYLLSPERTLFEPADDALQRLVDSEQGSVAVGASGILSRHSTLREERAVAMIRELGGTVTYDVDGADTQPFRGVMLQRPGDQTDARGLRPRDIVIRIDWTGGTEGLRYLRRLSHWRDLRLYVVRASGVPLAEAEKLAGVLPGLTVQERGAYLGIQNSPYSNTEICVVGEVIADGPAGRAGLKERDIIRAFNGDPVDGFDDLIEKLKDRAPGEHVTMTVDRHDFQTDKRERLAIDVNLGTWDLPSLTERAERFIQDAAESKAARRAFEERDDGTGEPVPTEAFPQIER